MLNSFTTNCFDPSHTCQQAYGYHNLLQGHFDVEMVSEDEIVAGRAARYKAVLVVQCEVPAAAASTTPWPPMPPTAAW